MPPTVSAPLQRVRTRGRRRRQLRAVLGGLLVCLISAVSIAMPAGSASAAESPILCPPGETKQYVKVVDFGTGSGTLNSAPGRVFTNADQTDFAGSEPSAYSSYPYQPNGRPTNGEYVVVSRFQALWYQPNTVDHTPGDANGRAYVSSFGLRAGGDDNNIAVGIALPQIPAGQRIYPSFYASITGGALEMRLRNEAGVVVKEAPVTLSGTANQAYALYEMDYVVQPGDGVLRFEVINTRAETTGNDGAIDDIGVRVCAPTPALDYGDAPDASSATGVNYRTRIADSGPSHRTTPVFTGEPKYTLGATVTGEADGQPSAAANADSGDDGVRLPGGASLQDQALRRGSSVQLTVLARTSDATKPGYLVGWIDFNRDGDFLDAGEQIAADVVPVAGAAGVTFTVPAGASLGATMARFRFSGESGVGTTGAALSGEVEDYRVFLSDTPPVVALTKSATANDVDGDGRVEAGETVTYRYVASNPGTVALLNVRVTETAARFTGTGPLPVPGYASGGSDQDADGASDDLAVGQSVTWSAVYTLTQADVDAGRVTNQATANAVDRNGIPTSAVSDDASTTTPGDPTIRPLTRAPALQIVKSGELQDTDGDGIVEAGETVAYSFALTNTGNVTLTGVTASETEFSGTGDLSAITCPATAASMAPGASVTCTAQYTLTQADVDAEVLTNAATATGTPPEGPAITSPPSEHELPLPAAPVLTLVKAVPFGSAAVSSWNLAATGPAGALPGPSGASGSAEATGVPVSPDQPYALSESGGPATYVQVGSWSCVDDAGAAVEVTPAGAVTLAQGQDVTCTVTNQTALLTLLKVVVNDNGGTISPDAFELTASPDALTGLAATTVTGESAISTANTVEVRPGHDYALTEDLGAYAYLGQALQQYTGPANPTAAQLADAVNWSTLTDAQAAAVSVAAGEHAIYRFVNDDAPALALPLTGGIGADSYLFGGAGVLLLGLLAAAALLVRSRIRSHREELA